MYIIVESLSLTLLPLLPNSPPQGQQMFLIYASRDVKYIWKKIRACMYVCIFILFLMIAFLIS